MRNANITIELARGAPFDVPFCSHLQPLASGCQVAASDCYFCPDNIMMSEENQDFCNVVCEEILFVS